VIGHGGFQIRQVVVRLSPTGLALHFVEQAHQLGSGDALATALAGRHTQRGDLLVLPCDTPLIRPATLAELVYIHRVNELSAATILVAELDDPTGYGRVLRATDGSVAKVVEQADASPEEAAVHEINASVYCLRTEALGACMSELSPANAQGELYLPDLLAALANRGLPVAAVTVTDPAEVLGVNDQAQLAGVEALWRAPD
jgi:bifunctional UDP-N-acetylglucosamine pyrophosphorylase/glucosamine-1-phosphate N-acetyltransferase